MEKVSIKDKTATDVYTVLGVVFVVEETDNSFGNKGTIAVFSDRSKADAYKKERCGNDEWCTIEVKEFTLNNA